MHARSPPLQSGSGSYSPPRLVWERPAVCTAATVVWYGACVWCMCLVHVCGVEPLDKKVICLRCCGTSHCGTEYSLAKHRRPGALAATNQLLRSHHIHSTYSPTDPAVLCLPQAQLTPTAATDKAISTMDLRFQWRDDSDPKGGMYAYVKGLVDTARRGDMDAVFPGLSAMLAQQGLRPVGMCLVKFTNPNSPICTCPAGMSLDATGINCTGTPRA